MTEPILPTYFVQHPDGTYSAAPRQPKLVAWMHPRVLSFKNAVRTSCPVELQPEIEGTVAWGPEIYGDDYEVVDKHGVVHRPYPLYALEGTP